MAEVFLVHFGDNHKYISCYKELAEKLPGPPTAILLGDAYLNVLEVQISYCSVALLVGSCVSSTTA